MNTGKNSDCYFFNLFSNPPSNKAKHDCLHAYTLKAFIVQYIRDFPLLVIEVKVRFSPRSRRTTAIYMASYHTVWHVYTKSLHYASNSQMKSHCELNHQPCMSRLNCLWECVPLETSVPMSHKKIHKTLLMRGSWLPRATGRYFFRRDTEI